MTTAHESQEQTTSTATAADPAHPTERTRRTGSGGLDPSSLDTPAKVLEALPPEVVSRLASLGRASDLVVSHALSGLREGSWRTLRSYDVVEPADSDKPDNRELPVVTPRTRAVIREAVRIERDRSKKLTNEERESADTFIHAHLEATGGSPTRSDTDVTGASSALVSGVMKRLRAGFSRWRGTGSSATRSH